MHETYIDWKEKNVAQDFEDAGTKESEMNEKDGPKSAIEDVKRWPQ